MQNKDQKGQGTIEYLVIIAVVIVIALVVVGLLTGLFGDLGLSSIFVTPEIKGQIGSGGVSVVDAASDLDGKILLVLQNDSSDSFEITDINSGGGKSSYLPTNLILGDERRFLLDASNLECICSAGETRRICEFTVTLTSAAGLIKQEQIKTTVDCISQIVDNPTIIHPSTVGLMSLSWARASHDINPPIANMESAGEQVGIDSSGNVFVYGYAHREYTDINFGDVYLSASPSEGRYAFLAKYNPTGTVLWAIGIPNAWSGAYPQPLAVDSSGNVYITGNTDSNIDLGGGVIYYSNDWRDFFIAKIASNGTPLWIRGAGANSANSEGFTVGLDLSGNPMLAGLFGGDLNIDNHILTDLGDAMVFVVKYDSDGNYLLSHTSRINGAMNIKNGIVDSSGNSYFTGVQQADVNFGGNVTIASNGNQNYYAVKYDSNGNPLWAKTSYSRNTDLRSIAIDTLGNVLFTGYYSGGFFGNPDLNIGETVLHGTSADNLFVLKYSSAGSLVWAKVSDILGASTVLFPGGMVSDSENNVYIAGQYRSGDANFGSIYFPTPILSTFNFFVLKYSSLGVPIWGDYAKSSQALMSIYLNSISASSNGSIATIGEFNTIDINFGSYILPALYDRNTSFFVVKYAQAQ